MRHTATQARHDTAQAIPSGTASQIVDRCTASRGKLLGRCENRSFAEYAQAQPIGDHVRIVWLKRCPDHPMKNNQGVREIARDV